MYGVSSFDYYMTPAKKTARKTKALVPWEHKFVEKLRPLHPRSYSVKAKKLMRKTTAALTSMVTRSAKQGVSCTITLDQIRQMTLDAYGLDCPYSGRQLVLENIVYDHIIPVSKGGDSSLENIQIISRFANNIKGALNEEDFMLLLSWIAELPPHLSKEVAYRLAGGKYH
jgi:5-methylcytosine-specific restriction endonuclease McrA